MADEPAPTMGFPVFHTQSSMFPSIQTQRRIEPKYADVLIIRATCLIIVTWIAVDIIWRIMKYPPYSY